MLLLLLLFCGGKALLLHRRRPRRRRPLPSVFGIIYISFFCHAVMMMMMMMSHSVDIILFMAFQTSRINSRMKEYTLYISFQNLPYRFFLLR